MKKHIIVIGGGMAGTAAAHRLRQLGYYVTILEKNDRLGGRIYSYNIQRTIVELGAGFLTSSYYKVLSFLITSGLEKQRYAQRSKLKIIRDKRILSSTALFLSLTFRSKLLFIKLFSTVLFLWQRISIKNPAGRAAFDTRSVADIFTKKTDKQVLEYILQPILNGYCFWKPEQTSQAMLLVIVKFLISGGRYRLKKGLQQIPEAAAKGSKVLLEHHVTGVKCNRNGSYLITVLFKGKLHTLQADGVVCATTALDIPSIFTDLSSPQKKFFSSVAYTSTVVVACVYKQREMSKNVSLAIPRREKSDVATITATSEVHKDTVYRAVKIYIPGKKFLALPDKAIIKIATERIALVQGILLTNEAKIITTQVHRWEEAIPVFDKGDMTRVKTVISTIESPMCPLVFAGDYLGGPCIEWAFSNGTLAAERLHGRLSA